MIKIIRERKNVVDGIEFIENLVLSAGDIDNDTPKKEDIYSIKIFLDRSDDLVAGDFYVFGSDRENFMQLFKKATEYFGIDWTVTINTIKTDRRYFDFVNRFRNLIKKKSFLMPIPPINNSEWVWSGKRFIIK